MQQLKNQHFQLLLNERTIAELTFDDEGRPTLGNSPDLETVRAFCAVMTLILGEYPPPRTDLILNIQEPQPNFRYTYRRSLGHQANEKPKPPDK